MLYDTSSDSRICMCTFSIFSSHYGRPKMLYHIYYHFTKFSVFVWSPDARSRDKTPMTKCHCPKPQYKNCSPPTPTPKHINQWHFMHWLFVRGIQTRYPDARIRYQYIRKRSRKHSVHYYSDNTNS